VSRTIALLCTALLALAFTAACGSDEQGDDGSAAVPTPESTTTETGCERVEAPEPKGEGDLAKPRERLDRGSTYVAAVSTSCGDFDIRLDVKGSPKTAASFAHLAEEGLYDGTTFHRVVPSFVIQGGDPKGDGTGGPGYAVVEAPPQDAAYTKGVVAMAKTGAEPPGTSGSQFFVVTAEDAQLPPHYAVLGEVVEGQAAVDRIAAAQTDPATERPVDPIVIRSVDVAER
jgi:peptidyl-prolyl cis-trans isomerase B (cyclophilin B)